jgi:hypothetical protein
MKSEQIEVLRGSENVFRDFGHELADVEQLKAILAAEIINMLDREGLSVRGAHSRTGVAAADFPASVTQTLDDSPLTVWCRSSIDSDRGLRSK